MTHTRVCLTPSRLPERPTRRMWQGLLEDPDQTLSCLQCGQNSAVFVTQLCEHVKKKSQQWTEISNRPICPTLFYFLAGGHSLTIRAPMLSSAQCQTIPFQQGGHSSCDSYKVAEGTVYFSWSASNERAANSNKSQLCNAATFPLW